MASKLPKFGLKSPIFGRFQKFFFQHQTTHRDTHFIIKQKFFPKKYVVSRFKNRFTPILGSKKRKTPYLSPGGSEAKNFWGHNQGWVDLQNEPLVAQIGKNRWAALGRLSDGRPVNSSAYANISTFHCFKFASVLPPGHR